MNVLSRTGFLRKTCLALAASAVVSFLGSSSHAAETKYSFSAGLDFTSHFISFGADVWGGGDSFSPFSAKSTVFGYGTLSAEFTDQISAFVNIWSDLNDNVDSAIGGPIQEVDFNVGVTYTLEKFSFTLTHNYWLYAGDNENAVELAVAYDDSELWGGKFALNPSALIHYRYEGQSGQEECAVIQLGVAPTVYTFMEESDYPISISVPAAVAFFTDDYQGGDSGFGYANIGVKASVPLAFIPPEYGAWSAGASVTYWFTPDDAIPGNPEESFVVTALSVGFSY
ncbi:MAG: hypothetical protein KatS3mg104_0888 [Phycisphaerae bacterium]|jgi:hypothetical protein|nr:MAG: hypothetical protein KatS3mg104_0888 [Phycisphaerae bacterium]